VQLEGWRSLGLWYGDCLEELRDAGRTLVVGGAVCIGCRTVKQQWRSGFEVMKLDDLASGCSDPVLTDDFIEGDMSNRDLLAGIFGGRTLLL